MSNLARANLARRSSCHLAPVSTPCLNVWVGWSGVAEPCSVLDRHTHITPHTHTHARTRARARARTHAHTADTHQERSGEVELTRPWSYQGFREASLEEFVRDVVLPCAAEAAEVERQRSGIDRTL